MIKKCLLKIMTVSIIISLISGCGKKQEYQKGEFTPEEQAKDSADVLTIKPEPIDYDSMLIVISQLVEAVKNHPTDIELRQELVAVSYDTTWETILAAGSGKPSQQAETGSLAMKYAERAATADAYRWAAYIKKWSVDPTFPDVATLSAEIQGGKVVAKKVLPDQTVSVLVEIHTSKIL